MSPARDKASRFFYLIFNDAKGIAKKDSDIDIFIEGANKKIKIQLEDFDSKLSIKIGKYDKTNLLIKEIEKNHVIIKGIQGYYEKNKFFE